MFKIKQIKAGEGDYFFGYGIRQVEKDGPTLGWIFKMDMEGEMIWSRTYSHPDFTMNIYSNSIEDLVELEDGNLVVCGDILDITTFQNRIWIMGLDEDGCLSENNCSQLSSMTLNEEPKQRLLYPNPAISEIYLPELCSQIKSIQLYNSIGYKLYCPQDVYSKSLDVEALNQGIYILHLTCYDDKKFVFRFVKN